MSIENKSGQSAANPTNESAQALGFAPPKSTIKDLAIATGTVAVGVTVASGVVAGVKYGAGKIFGKSSEKVAKQGAAAFVGGIASKLF
jgi:uncharacterized membrane-anchored protein